MKALRAVAALLLGFAGSFAAVRASDTASDRKEDGVILGGIDLPAYCKQMYGERETAVLVQQNIFGWQCTSRSNGIFDLVDIDVDDACAAMYDGPTHAQAYDSTQPYSWECISGRRP